jgi:hypothetical protein
MKINFIKVLVVDQNWRSRKYEYFMKIIYTDLIFGHNVLYGISSYTTMF